MSLPDLTSIPVLLIDNQNARVFEDGYHIRRKHSDPDLIEIGIHTPYVTVQREEDLLECVRRSMKGKKLFKKENVSELQFHVSQEKREVFSVIASFSEKENSMKRLRYGKTLISVKGKMTFNEFDQIVNNPEISKHPDEIKKAVLLLHKFTTSYFRVNQLNGSTIIESLGKRFCEVLAKQLRKVYNDDALLHMTQSFPPKYTTSFRSPLRKLLDLCVIQQLESVEKKLSTEEMKKKVAFRDELFRAIHDMEVRKNDTRIKLILSTKT